MTYHTDDGWEAVHAPATVANVGPGYDCLGFSLGDPGDVVRARLTDDAPGTVRIHEIRGVEAAALPREPERNCAGRAAAVALASDPAIAARHGVELVIEKGIRAGSGLGSSARRARSRAPSRPSRRSRAGGRRFDEATALAAALEGEAVASGARHADNVAPSLLGGFTLVQPGDPPRVARLDPALRAHVAVVTPAVIVTTKEAREALPKTVSLADAVATWSNVAGVVAAILTGDEALLRRSLDDPIVEPVRAKLIPGFADVKRAALDAGALGCCISGSGPTMFALVRDAERAQAIVGAMKAAFASHDVKSVGGVGRLGARGARRVEADA